MSIDGCKRNHLLIFCSVTGICLMLYLSGEPTHTIEDMSKNLTSMVTQPAILKEKVYIPDNYTGIPCNYTLNLPHEQMVEKINSYQFPGLQKYISDLFPNADRTVLPEDPVFVSAFSSNHYEEGLAMIYNFTNVINVNKTRKLIVFDIGLTAEENRIVKKECRCEVRNFPFGKFPNHVGILKGCPWKPIAIQLVAREHPFVVWMDASIRFKTSKLDELAKIARKYGVLASKGIFSIAHQSALQTFRFLNEIPCLFSRTPEIEANFIVLYQTPFVEKYFMTPWVSCALIKACMMTFEDVEKAYNCNGARHYFHCHRFDQSIFSILIYRLFNRSIDNNLIPISKFHSVCRDCRKRE